MGTLHLAVNVLVFLTPTLLTFKDAMLQDHLHFFPEIQVGTLLRTEIFSFFLRAPYILQTTYFSSDDGGQRCQGLKPYLLEKVKMACRSIIHGARGLAVGVLTPIPLWLGLGQLGSGGLVH